MYEGEECVNAVAPPVCADKEPVYEGESLLGKRAEKNVDDSSSEGKATDGLTAKEGKYNVPLCIETCLLFEILIHYHLSFAR